jgi:hypothetical protein
MYWAAYLYPKSWYKANEINSEKIVKSFLSVGRRFGKTGMLYHSIVDSLPVSDEKKKELHEQYEKALRGEE